MSEEEKKAIEYLKRHIIPVYGRKGNIEYLLNDIILNLIEEQQNKIASLQKEIKLMKSININDNYISKDKIRKLKEYYEDSFKYAENEIESNNIYVSIKILEKLLEE